MDVLRLLFRAVFRLLVWTGWLLVFLLKHGGRWLWRLVRPRSTTHGSARWATLRDLMRGRALGGDRGLIVGKKYGQFLRFRGEGAVMVCAPQSKGKGVGIVVPNLLEHKGSVIVTDPKGENFKVTQRHRSSMGPVWRLDTINPAESNFFNPLSMIRKGTFDEDTDAAQMASFLVIRESSDSHWDTSAKQLLAALIRYVLHFYPEEQQTLSTVRELIACERETLEKLFEKMAACQIPSLAEEARSVLQAFGSSEMTSVIRNTAKGMTFWSKDKVGGWITRTSEFDMMDLHREGMTIYVMVPDSKIEMFKPFLRVMMGCAVDALMRGKDLPIPQHKPMLLIDEAKALGRLDILETEMGMLRAYCHTVIVWQDLGQLNELYGHDTARTFVSGSGAQVTFGVSDTKTAQDLATDIGRHTVMANSRGVAAGNMNLLQAQHQNGESEVGRDLLDHSEIRFMDPTKCVVFMPDQVSAPILATKVRYYTEWRWRGLHDPWRPSSAEVIPLPSARLFPMTDGDADVLTMAPRERARAPTSHVRAH